MSGVISTDFPLTASERTVLTALLDTLIPASDDGTLPSAADVSFERYLLEQAEDQIAGIQAALQHFDPSFPELTLEERSCLVYEFSADDRETFVTLLSRVYDCYYQDSRVREGIGVVTGAPFPQGNTVDAGDLSLLDPVIEQRARHEYRKT